MTTETKPKDAPQTPASATPAATPAAAVPETKLDAEAGLNDKELDGVVGGRFA